MMTFKELVNYNKENRDDRLPFLADKIKVKLFAGERDVHTAPILFVYPDKDFIIKPSAGSQSYEKVDRIPKPYGTDKGEWWYGEIDNKYFIEEFIPRKNEYQFHCKDGKAFWLQIKTPKPHQHQERVVDMEGNDMNINIWSKNKYNADLPIPDNFEELRNAAERLAEGLVYVRVDLYNYDNKIYLSEMTFSPVAGNVTDEAGKIEIQ